MDRPELVLREPDPSLRGLVDAYYGYREDTGRPTRRREGPGGGEVVVVLGFDTVWWLGDALDPAGTGGLHTAFVGGARESQVLTEHPGRSSGMQVNLTPHGARELFRVPLDALANRIVALDDLLGRRVTLLTEELQEQPTWEARFAVLEATLRAWLPGDRPPAGGAGWAYARLQATHGRVRIEALAGELGWSRKRLVSAFREDIGLTPKKLARVLRFERAVELAEHGRLGWAEVAFASGYSDQAHLSNEFRRISGTTPGTFFQDVVAAQA